MERGLTRRRLLEAAGAGVALAGLPPGALAAAAKPRHQAGIATPEQPRLLFAALDANAANRGELRQLMKDWTATARKLSTHGRTITFGFGPSLFDKYSLDRPQPLQPLPAFAGDQLDPAKCDGDLAIQICGDHVDVLDHFAGAEVRWAVHGHHRKDRRNNLGFKEGANNIAPDDPVAMKHSVWVGAHDKPGWMRGGSYLVARRIRLNLDDWNATPVHRQERVIGRHKRSGAPLGGHHEYDQADFDAGVTSGDPVIPTDAHIRLASPEANGGKMLLRRSYNYEGGLLFLAYQRNPRQFIGIQRRLGQHDDALSSFIVHEGSALFAMPPAPGPKPDGFIGDGLLVR
ncbi:MAG: deferrochelatase/peroxidase EfeB [Thermoleophilaceae bacterium]|nr:deferrochelatase/peroxidase EfeB [Thermoleophilaceae bacterium]